MNYFAPSDMAGPHIFERQEGEPAKAFAIFEAYCELGTGRKINDLAKKVNRTAKYLYRLSSAWRWADRAAAWDRVELTKVHAEVHAQRVRVALMELAVARGMLHWPARYLAAMTDEKLQDMTPTEIARWASTGATLARCPLGEPDTRVALGTVDESGGFRPITSMSETERRAELGQLLTTIGRKVSAGEAIEDEETLLAFLSIPPQRTSPDDGASADADADASEG